VGKARERGSAPSKGKESRPGENRITIGGVGNQGGSHWIAIKKKKGRKKIKNRASDSRKRMWEGDPQREGSLPIGRGKYETTAHGRDTEKKKKNAGFGTVKISSGKHSSREKDRKKEPHPHERDGYGIKKASQRNREDYLWGCTPKKAAHPFA